MKVGVHIHERPLGLTVLGCLLLWCLCLDIHQRAMCLRSRLLLCSNLCFRKFQSNGGFLALLERSLHGLVVSPECALGLVEPLA